MSELKIYFVDLIGYAIRQKYLWALMPRGEGHLPMLVYFSDNNPGGDLNLGHGLQAVFPLDRHVTLDPDNGTAVETPGADPVGDFPARAGESFKWVTKLDQIAHEGLGNCRLNEGVFASPPQPDRISSRFFLKGGKIRSERYVVDRLDEPPYMGAYRFPKGFNMFRSMVNVTKLERDLESETVSLKLESWSGDPNRTITLHPEGDGGISCVYMNLATSRANPGSHFYMFAKLLECDGDLPPDGELKPTRKRLRTSVNPALDGILGALRPALADQGVIRALEEMSGRAVYVDPEACPQGRYE